MTGMIVTTEHLNDMIRISYERVGPDVMTEALGHQEVAGMNKV